MSAPSGWTLRLYPPLHPPGAGPCVCTLREPGPVSARSGSRALCPHAPGPRPCACTLRQPRAARRVRQLAAVMDEAPCDCATNGRGQPHGVTLRRIRGLRIKPDYFYTHTPPSHAHPTNSNHTPKTLPRTQNSAHTAPLHTYPTNSYHTPTHHYTYKTMQTNCTTSGIPH